MRDPALVLRDIHPAVAPAWWPPAPGWWLLVAVLVVAVVVLAWWRGRKRRRLHRIEAVFDEALASACSEPECIVAMSDLLRRAARRRDPRADKLHGEAWLSFLDADDAHRPFTQGAGRLLLDGGFRRDADPRQVAQLHSLARDRFLRWMAQ